MIENSSNLMISKEKYNKSKTSEKLFLNQKPSSSSKDITVKGPSEWIDKLSRDIDNISKDAIKIEQYKDKEAVNTKTLSGNNSKLNLATKTTNSVPTKRNSVEKNKKTNQIKIVKNKSPNLKKNESLTKPKKNETTINSMTNNNNYETISKELEAGLKSKGSIIDNFYNEETFKSNQEIKNDVNEIYNLVRKLTLRVESLEFENKQLKEENKNFYQLISLNLKQNSNDSNFDNDNKPSNNHNNINNNKNTIEV